MNASIERFKEEISKIRTGRANPLLVENIMVDYFGSKAPLKQIASISVPEPRLIVISPWNKDNLVDIEKAINDSKIGLNPTNDGQVIRLAVPALNEERRKEIVKMLNKKAEEAKVAIRSAREEVWDEIQEKVREGELDEDAKFTGKDRLQELVDEFNSQVESIRARKEKEIMEV